MERAWASTELLVVLLLRSAAFHLAQKGFGEVIFDGIHHQYAKTINSYI